MESTSPQNPVRILTIDGGGIRGIIPGTVLHEIEQITGKRIAELFDIIAGTSTGGILALGLTIPGANGKPKYTAEEILGIYGKNGGRIFKKGGLLKKLQGLFDESYDKEGIEDTLYEYFGEVRFKELMTNVLVTAYEIERRQSWVFRKERAIKDEAFNFKITDIARATSAAPTYFEPHSMPFGDGSDKLYFVDGGVYANNPALIAYAEAKRMLRGEVKRTISKDKDIAMDEIVPVEDDNRNYVMVSLGTGSMTTPVLYDKAKDWGAIGWLRPLIDILMQGNSSNVDYILSQLLPPTTDGVKRYYRINTDKPAYNEAMDDVSPQNIEALFDLGKNAIDSNKSDIEQLCSLLCR